MRVLGVGGASSGVGKTAVVCLLLEALPGWGTLKTSVFPTDPTRDEPLPGGFEVISDPEVLNRSGTDTARFVAAGSARVKWLRSQRGSLGKGIATALAEFADLPGVIVEGNSFAAHRKPDAFVLVVRSGLREIKPSAWDLRPDWLVLNDLGTADESDLAWLLELPDPLRKPAIVIDAGSAEHDGSARLIAEVSAWSRR